MKKIFLFSGCTGTGEKCVSLDCTEPYNNTRSGVLQNGETPIFEDIQTGWHPSVFSASRAGKILDWTWAQRKKSRKNLFDSPCLP